MKKRIFSLLLATAFSISLLAGCSGESDTSDKNAADNISKTGSEEPEEKELTEVTLNEVAHSIFYAPMYVAIEEGYFEEEGIALDLVCGFGADKTMTAVISGEAEIGFMGSEASIYTYNEGAEDYVVNFAQLTQRAGNFLVAREEMDDFKWEDLKGHLVLGGRKGGMPEMVFEFILKQNGIDPETDLEINQNIDFGSTAAAFSEGQGEFTVEFEPGATTLESEGKGYVVASLGEDSGYVPYTAFSARKSYIEENEELIQNFTDAIYKGQQWTQSHSAREIAELIQDFFPDTDIDMLESSIQRYKDIDAWNQTPVLTEEAFNNLQDVMEEAGELSKRADYSKIVNNKYAQQAIENN